MIAYLGIAAAAAIAGATLYAIDADRALDREQKARVAAELQRDQFAKGLTQCRTDIAEKNRILLDAAALPLVRKRLCAQRVPTDPCCRPAPAPPAEDACKPDAEAKP